MAGGLYRLITSLTAARPNASENSIEIVADQRPRPRDSADIPFVTAPFVRFVFLSAKSNRFARKRETTELQTDAFGMATRAVGRFNIEKDMRNAQHINGQPRVRGLTNGWRMYFCSRESPQRRERSASTDNLASSDNFFKFCAMDRRCGAKSRVPSAVVSRHSMLNRICHSFLLLNSFPNVNNHFRERMLRQGDWGENNHCGSNRRERQA
jgi:hypothetical protein